MFHETSNKGLRSSLKYLLREEQRQTVFLGYLRGHTYWMLHAYQKDVTFGRAAWQSSLNFWGSCSRNLPVWMSSVLMTNILSKEKARKLNPYFNRFCLCVLPTASSAYVIYSVLERRRDTRYVFTPFILACVACSKRGTWGVPPWVTPVIKIFKTNSAGGRMPAEWMEKGILNKTGLGRALGFQYYWPPLFPCSRLLPPLWWWLPAPQHNWEKS